VRVITAEQLQAAVSVSDFLKPVGQALSDYSRSNVLAAPTALSRCLAAKCTSRRPCSRWAVLVGQGGGQCSRQRSQ